MAALVLGGLFRYVALARGFRGLLVAFTAQRVA